MPYKSRSQQKYFHYLESKGKLPKKTVHEFDESTDYSHLPEHVGYAKGGMIPELEYGEEEAPHNDEHMPKYADGGIIGTNYDYDMGHAEEYDSAGEPHTEDDLEDEHPMEFMHRGGKVKKMSKGGMALRSHFVKALKRAR